MARTIHDWRKAFKLRCQQLAEDEDLMRLATWQQMLTNCEDVIYGEGLSDKIVNYDDDDDDEKLSAVKARRRSIFPARISPLV